jgi:hypothetical protein
MSEFDVVAEVVLCFEAESQEEANQKSLEYLLGIFAEAKIIKK